MFADIAKMTATAVSEEIKKLSLSDYPEAIAVLTQDNRKSVRNLAERLQKKLDAQEKAKLKILEMLQMESELRFNGYELICGIDEVGRGPLAGPVVAAAVIMPKNSAILGIDDSKKLSVAKREELDALIQSEALAWAVGVTDNQTIDAINILEATRLAMAEAVEKLSIRPNLLLIDAVRIPSEIPVRSVIHGDAICYSIAAASILAKVYRDRLMRDYHDLYPEYGFDANMGYGTQKHIEALKKYGPTPIHRKSFIKNFQCENKVL